ncbi:MAG: type II toxin-antitoxin system YafQ family toxin [Sedimenticola sp.]
MKTLSRHKRFIKDLRNTRLSDSQAAKLFLYIAALLNGEVLPEESRDHALSGEWSEFREFHIGGDTLIIYRAEKNHVHLARIGSLK